MTVTALSTLSTWNDWAAVWASGMARACWQGSLFILAVWSLCRVVPRLPAALRVWLWWLACLKLLVAFAWGTPLPVRVLSAPSPRPPETILIVEDSPAPSPPNLAGVESRESRVDSKRPYHSYSPLPSEGRAIGGASAAEQRLRASVGAGVRVLTPHASRLTPSLRPTIAAGLMLLWLALAVRRGLIAVRRWRVSHRLAREAAPLQDETIHRQAERIARAYGLRRRPPLRELARPGGPFVMGLAHPVILLPCQTAAGLSPDETRMVLAHELAHLRRGDLWLSLLPTLTQALFFFHPLAWLAGREFGLATEEACDAEVLRVTGAPAGEYGLLLLKVIGHPARPEIAAGLGAVSNFRTLERRLKMLQRFSLDLTRPSRRRIRCAMALLLGTGIVCVLPWRLAAQEIRPPAPTAKEKIGRTPRRASTVAPLTAPISPTLRTRSYYPGGNWDARPVTVSVPLQPATTAAAPTALPLLAPVILTTPAERAKLRVEITQPGAAAVTLTPVDPTTPRAATIPTVDPRATRALAITPLQGPATSVHAHDLTPTIGIPTTSSLAVPARTGTSIGITGAQDPIASTTVAPVRPGRTDPTVTVIGGVVAKGVAPRISGSPGQDPGQKRITLDLRGIDFFDAFKKLFEQAGVSYRIDEDVAQIARSGKTTIQMVDVPFRTGLDMLMGSTRTLKTPLTYLVHDGFYILAPRGSEEGDSGAPMVTRTDGNTHRIRSIEELYTARVTVRCTDANLRQVLKMMFEQFGANYTIDPRVGKDETVTASLTDVPFRTALQEILLQSRVPLSWRVQNDIYHIVPRQDSASTEEQNVVTRAQLLDYVHQKTALEADYRKAGLMYAPSHPHMVELRQQIDDLSAEIQETHKKLGG